MRRVTMLLALTAAALLPAAEPDKPPEPKPPYQRLLQGDDAKQAAELQKRMDALAAAAKFAEAVTAAEELHQLRRRVQGADHWETSSARWVAEALRRAGAQLPAKQLEYAALVSLVAEAAKLRQQGRYSQAEQQERRILALRQQVLGEENPYTATSYNNVAMNLNYQGKHAAAEPLLRKAVAILQKALGEEHPLTAQSYNNIALNLDAQGKHAAAEPLVRQALAIFQKALGEEHPLTALSYNNIALNLDAQGKHAAAEPLKRQALAIFQKALGEEHPDTATSYNNVAANLYAQGKHAAAEPLYRQALAIRQKALGEEHPLTAQSYNNIALNLDAQGKHTAAEPLVRQALAIFQKALGEEHPLTALSYNNIALNLDAQGKHTAAEPFVRQALAIFQKALGEEHPDTATSYNNVATNLNGQGKHAAAEPLVRQALAIRQKALGEEHPSTATSYIQVASILLALGRHAEAVEAGEHAARSFEAARLAGSSAGLDRALFAAARGSPFPTLAAAQARLGQADRAWQALEAHLGRGLLDALTARLPPRLTPEERPQQEQLRRKLAELAPQVLALVTRKEASAEDRRQLNQLLQERSRLETESADLAVRVAGREVAGLAAVQAQLAPDAALLAWVDVQGTRGAEDALNEHWACVVRKDGPPQWVLLPGQGPNGAWTKDDDTLIAHLRQSLASGGRQPPGLSAEAETGTKPGGLRPPLAGQLYRQRLAPVEKHLDGVKRLIVLPAGRMAGVPLEALTDRYTVTYAPSATVYTKLCQTRPTHTAPGRLLALGDPVFRSAAAAIAKPTPKPPDHGVLLTLVQQGGNGDKSGLRRGDVLLRYADRQLTNADDLKPQEGTEPIPVQVWRDGQTLDLKVQPGRLGVQPSRFKAAEAIAADRAVTAALERCQRGPDRVPLPGTRREVEAIRKLFDQADVLLGSDASEQKLVQLAKDGLLKPYRYLHFATHGEVDAGNAAKCALVLAQDQLPDPLKQSLAGQRLYDGKVDVAEILDEWQLDAELVVFSACETALGQEAGGEGLMGFSQALLSKGARSLLVSLWRVDDTATALLMVRFYQNLLGRRAGGVSPPVKPLPKAEALREAKHWLRNLTAEEVQKQAANLPEAVRGSVTEKKPVIASAKPYEHPYYWSAFILIGDPE